MNIWGTLGEQLNVGRRTSCEKSQEVRQTFCLPNLLIKISRVSSTNIHQTSSRFVKKVDKSRGRFAEQTRFAVSQNEPPRTVCGLQPWVENGSEDEPSALLCLPEANLMVVGLRATDGCALALAGRSGREAGRTLTPVWTSQLEDISDCKKR